MVTDLQYVAVVLYLAWCLISSLSGAMKPDQTELVGQRERTAS